MRKIAYKLKVSRFGIDIFVRYFYSVCRTIIKRIVKNVVYINKQSYDYIVSFKNIHESCIQIPSNTEIIIDGVIRVRGNDLNGYRVFFINNKENIIIRGNGNIIGDFYEDDEIIPNTGKHDLNGIQEYGGHTYTTHEYCHAIVSYDSKKINLQNITISRFPGDALALGNDYMDIHNQIIVENCELYKCRRQGISIIGHNYIIRNNHIHDIKGTAPQSAIDIEPNNNINTCSNILIENNIIENCEYGICIVGSNGEINSVKISNNTVKAQNPIYSAGKDNKNIII